VIGYVSDDYRHVVDAQRRPLLLITDYHSEGKTAFVHAVDDNGQRWQGVAGHQPNARVVMRKRVD
jgi:hypothetical protein